MNKENLEKLSKEDLIKLCIETEKNFRNMIEISKDLINLSKEHEKNFGKVSKVAGNLLVILDNQIALTSEKSVIPSISETLESLFGTKLPIETPKKN
jgi:hypothetical protein